MKANFNWKLCSCNILAENWSSQIQGYLYTIAPPHRTALSSVFYLGFHKVAPACKLCSISFAYLLLPGNFTQGSVLSFRTFLLLSFCWCLAGVLIASVILPMSFMHCVCCCPLRFCLASLVISINVLYYLPTPCEDLCLDCKPFEAMDQKGHSDGMRIKNLLQNLLRAEHLW